MNTSQLVLVQGRVWAIRGGKDQPHHFFSFSNKALRKFKNVENYEEIELVKY